MSVPVPEFGARREAALSLNRLLDVPDASELQHTLQDAALAFYNKPCRETHALCNDLGDILEQTGQETSPFAQAYWQSVIDTMLLY